ncbi:MAG: hypothetical protein ACYDCC_14210 [Actinomycetota bacterium]
MSSAWPEADALFRSDPRWLGSDDASSVELAPGRILWLFGDTFIANGSSKNRRGALFPRNTIGIQTGSDPASASMEFFWREKGGSFFGAPDDSWYWPLHGALIDGSLIVFQMLVRSPRPGLDPIADWRELGALGFFRVDGWSAMHIRNPDDSPNDWLIETLAIRESPIVIGSAVLVREEHLLAYAWDERKQIFLARWPLAAFSTDELDEPEWWCGSGWSSDQREAVIEKGSTEFSVHFDPRLGSFVQTQTMFNAHAFGLRLSEKPEGPWSEIKKIHTPEEANRVGVFTYAAKSHPELSGGGIVVTYASNSDVETCLDDQSIYYPRFVRVDSELA